MDRKPFVSENVVKYDVDNSFNSMFLKHLSVDRNTVKNEKRLHFLFQL